MPAIHFSKTIRLSIYTKLGIGRVVQLDQHIETKRVSIFGQPTELIVAGGTIIGVSWLQQTGAYVDIDSHSELREHSPSAPVKEPARLIS